MTATALMERLENIGVKLEVVDDRLRFFPAELVTDDLRQEMATHKSEILRLLRKPQAKVLDRNEITWRVEAMSEQMANHQGAFYPTLTARQDISSKLGLCFSCGEVMRQMKSLYVCDLCVQASYLVLRLSEVQ